MKDKVKENLFLKAAARIRKLYSIYEENILIRNFYKTDYPKNALISYLLRPFRKGAELAHTNQAEALEIANVLKKLGYNVDIVNYSSMKLLDYDSYDLIFGFGEPLINSFYLRDKCIFTIYYGTGMHVCHQNNVTLKRIEDVYRKKAKWLLNSGRIVDKAWSVQTTLVDAMIILGNEVTAKSYQKYFSRPVICIPASYQRVTDYKDIVKQKDYYDAKRHFLWFGGNGLIHKGLDLLLEVFKDSSEIHLHVCGPISEEKEFQECFYQELYNTTNIHTYDFVKLDSQIFVELMKKCAFAILPACSEGQATSLINVVANGALIPIATKESGLDITRYGIEIEESTVEYIRGAIERSLSMTVETIEANSRECGRYITEAHSIEAFSEQLENALGQLLPN